MTDDLGPRPAPGQSKRGSRMTEVFFSAEERPADLPVLIFHHIQKTAGSALRRVVRANLGGGEVHHGRVRSLRDRTREELAGWYGDWYASLDGGLRSRLRAVMAHTANFMVPVLDAPALTVAIVRDPVDRAISQYYFADSNRGKPVQASGVALSSYYKQEHPSTLGDIYRELAGARPGDGLVANRHSRFFNGQTRSLLAPHHDTAELAYTEGPPPDADLWRERLFGVVDEHYRLGVQERVAQFARDVEQRMGWAHSELTRKKVNAERPRLAELPDGFADRLRAFNWLDDELHRRTARLEAEAVAA
jgi:hypothetical protein